MAYDRKLGGWRGPVGHLDGGAGAGDELGRRRWRRWPRPPGMLPDWQLAVVLETTDSEAQARLARCAAGQPPQPRTGALPLSDLAWARPVQGRQAWAGAAAHDRRDAAGRRGDGRAATASAAGRAAGEGRASRRRRR